MIFESTARSQPRSASHHCGVAAQLGTECAEDNLEYDTQYYEVMVSLVIHEGNSI